MGFASGTMTFKRFLVKGQQVDQADEALLDRLSGHAITADRVERADKVHYGWVAGGHLQDVRFSLAKNAVADGLCFGLRIDTHKPPADLVKSYQRQAAEAMLEASGREFLSKAERREAREQGAARADSEARAGAFLRMKQIPVFWDLKRSEVYLGSTSPGVADPFMMLFAHSFDRQLVPASAGELAARWAIRGGESSAFDGCAPAHFVSPPAGGEEAPLVTNEPGSRDFLGTEWLTWLWYTAQVESAEVALPQGSPITVLFDRTLQMVCPFDLTGTMTLTAEGPTRLAEAPVALASGKLPVKAGLQLAAHGDAYSLTIRGDAMNYSGVQVPPPAEGIVGERALLEDRVDHLRVLIEAMDGLYAAFLRRRLSGKWSQTLSAMRSWIGSLRHATNPPAELAAS